MTPFAFPAIAVFPTVDDPFPAPPRQLMRPLPPEPKSFKGTRPVTVDDDIGILEELVELAPSLGSFEVDIHIPFPDLAVRDERQRFRLRVCRDTQDIRTHHSKDACHDRTGNHPRQVEHFDAGQWPATLRLAVRPRRGRELLVQFVDLVERLFQVLSAVRRGRILVDRSAGPAGLQPSLVGFDLERRAVSFGDDGSENVFDRLDVLLTLEVRAMLWQV